MFHCHPCYQRLCCCLVLSNCTNEESDRVRNGLRKEEACSKNSARQFPFAAAAVTLPPPSTLDLHLHLSPPPRLNLDWR